MSAKAENDDDSFIIILGTSPGASMDVEKCNGVVNGDLAKSQLEDAMKDLSVEANMAFKAQFHLGDSPSPASMMVASTLITDDRSTEELQKRFGELLDENVVLKETLKQNNDSMKEQFMLIASCQEDMLKTHKLHKQKFDETRELVERLRQENKQLKLDVSRLSDSEIPINSETGESKSGVSSGVEFVASPDDDTINKLTAQLELVEKQRRQVIVENEKLTWQKDSLEHIVDATSKERDDAKEKLKNVELLLSSKENEHAQELQKLHFIINDLQAKLKSSSSSVSHEEIVKRDTYIQQLEAKLSAHQNELKKAQIKILDLENIKLEFTQHKSGVAETTKMYKEQVQDLNNRIKDMQTVVFHPVHFSMSTEADSLSEYASYASNVKVYDRTLKHLSEYLTNLTNGLSDSLVHTLGVIASLYDFKLERCSADRVKSGLAEVKQMIERQHSEALTNISQVRGTLSIFEGIFKDYTDLLKKSLTKQEPKPQSQSVEQLTVALVARGQELQALEAELNALKNYKDDCELLKAQVDLYKSDFEAERASREKLTGQRDNAHTDLRTAQRSVQELTAQKPQSQSVEQLTAALVARGQELQALEAELNALKNYKDDCELLKAQVDLYKSDFEAERASREKLAGERDNAHTDLRTAQRRVQELTAQLEEIRILSPGLHKSVTTKKAPSHPATPARITRHSPASTAAATTTTGNMVRKKKKIETKPNEELQPHEKTPPPLRFDCPVCDQPFKSLILLQQHVYECPKCMRFSSDQYKVMEEHFDFCLDDF